MKMELISAVKDCFGKVGYAGKVGALTAGLLVGGFVSNLFAGEDADAVKLKDLGKYEQIEKKNGTKKKKPRITLSSKSIFDNPLRYGSFESRDWRGLLFDADYISVWDSITGKSLSHGTSTSASFIGSDTYYWNSFFGVDYEEAGNLATGRSLTEMLFVINKPKIGKNPDKVEADIAVGVDLGLVDGRIYDNLDIGVNFGTHLRFNGADERNKRKKIPVEVLGELSLDFGSEDNIIDEVFPAPRQLKAHTVIDPFIIGAKAALRVGIEKIRGEIAAGIGGGNHITTIDDAVYDNSGSPVVAEYWKKLTEIHYRIALSVISEHESDLYFRVSYAYTGGNLSGEEEFPDYPASKKDLFFDRSFGEGLVTLLFPFSRNKSKPNYFGALFANVEKNQHNYLASFAIQSPGNSLAKTLVRRKIDFFSTDRLKSDKKIKRSLYDVAGRSHFSYIFDFGVRVSDSDPHKNYSMSKPEFAFLIFSMRAMHNIGIGNLHFKGTFENDVVTGKHPGNVELELALLGKMKFSILYKYQYDDHKNYKEGISTLGISFGLNY